MIESLDAKKAKRIIDYLGGSGQPPHYGIEFFSVGLESYLGAIEKEYLESHIMDGGNSFKVVVAPYGGGKTHFLYSVRSIGWKHGYATSYVSLNSNECPFHKIELVYKAIVDGLVPALSSEELIDDPDSGVSNFLRAYYGRKIQENMKLGLSTKEAKDIFLREVSLIETPSISFTRALRGALIAYHHGEQEDFELYCQWIRSEPPRLPLKKFGITEKIDKTTAFNMIRCLSRAVCQLGYTGLIILFDEAEQNNSLSSKETEKLLTTLREVIDECVGGRLKHTMFFYAVPNLGFLEKQGSIYEAVKQRLSTNFDTEINVSGVQINLGKTDIDQEEFMNSLGVRLCKIFEKAYNYAMDDKSEETIKVVIEHCLDNSMTDSYKRLFVQKLIYGLKWLRANNTVISKEQLG